MTYESKPQPETARAAIESLGLTMTAEFVPFSQRKIDWQEGSRDVNRMTINWTCTISRNDREIMTIPFAQGNGHLPNANNKPLPPDSIRYACENGKVPAHGEHFKRFVPIPPPKPEDVLHCLISDADAIDHPTFESWASDLGYDTDSRKAEATYRACLETALKLRAALGEDGLAKLREAFQDY